LPVQRGFHLLFGDRSQSDSQSHKLGLQTY
jgi:hypothetical protein